MKIFGKTKSPVWSPVWSLGLGCHYGLCGMCIRNPVRPIFHFTADKSDAPSKLHEAKATLLPRDTAGFALTIGVYTQEPSTGVSPSSVERLALQPTHKNCFLYVSGCAHKLAAVPFCRTRQQQAFGSTQSLKLRPNWNWSNHCRGNPVSVSNVTDVWWRFMAWLEKMRS